MARITVEDCVKVVPNRFELCLIASNRARSILSGSETTLDGKEKPSVIALREIAENLIDVNIIKKNIIHSIKNRGVIEVTPGQTSNPDRTNSEVELNNSLTSNTFVDENIQIDD